MLEILEEFYNEMKKAEQLAYESCRKRDAEQANILNTYADELIKTRSEKK